MKHLIRLSLVVLMLSPFALYAGKWRVNNQTGTTANFTAVSTAIASGSVLNGDTLYIEGSPTSYGTLSLTTKSLTFIGPGYLLPDNDSTQAIIYPARFDAMSVSGVATNNSVFMGMVFQNTTGGATLVTLGANGLTFSRNYIFTGTNGGNSFGSTGISVTSGFNNITISQNFINLQLTAASFTNTGINIAGINTNLLISNNLILVGQMDLTATNPGTANAITMSSTSGSAVIANNVFKGNLTLYNAQLFSNIWIAGTYTVNASFPNVLQNNISNSTQFGSANGNQQNITMTNVFAQTGSVASIDKFYRLTPSTSPALGTGVGGNDCGIFGGTLRYKLSGLPPFPAIWSATVPPSGSSGSNLNVNVRARAHN